MRGAFVRLAGSSFLAGCLWTCWLQGQPADRLIAITADRLIDATGNPTINDALIVVEGERIAAVGSREAVDIPEGAELIELGDQTLLPGMINSGGHIEFRGRKRGALPPQFDDPPYQNAGNVVWNIRLDLLTGVTTVREYGNVGFSEVGIAEAVRQGTIPGPRILSSGEGVEPTGGHAFVHHWYVDGPEAIVRKIRYNIAQGAHQVKVLSKDIGEVSQYTEEEIQAAVRELHRHGKFAVAHATSYTADTGASIRLCIESGVDVIEHPAPPPLSDEAIRLAAENNVFIGFYFNSTGLSTSRPDGKYLDPNFRDRIARNPRDWIDYARKHVQEKLALRGEEGLKTLRAFQQALLKAHQAGIKISCGYYPESGLQALNLEYLVEAGFTPMEAIIAATANGAASLQMEDRIGTLEVGKLADIISVEGDPIADIGAMSRVNFVMVGGRSYTDMSLH